MPIFEDANMPQFIIGELAWGMGKMLWDYQHSVKLQLPRNALSDVWSAAALQTKNVQWQLVCANVFGLKWSH